LLASDTPQSMETPLRKENRYCNSYYPYPSFGCTLSDTGGK